MQLANRVNEMNKVTVVHKVNVCKKVTFTTYPDESKGWVNVVNVVRKFFCLRRTWRAKRLHCFRD